jgi:hypothetical protein
MIDTTIDSPTEATVQTLTAEVRTLTIGSRQVTLSVARQLDVVPLNRLRVMGRVELGRRNARGPPHPPGKPRARRTCSCETPANVPIRRSPHPSSLAAVIAEATSSSMTSSSVSARRRIAGAKPTSSPRSLNISPHERDSVRAHPSPMASSTPAARW